MVIDLTTLVPQPDPLRDKEEEDLAGVDEDTRRGRALKRGGSVPTSMSAPPLQVKRVDRGPIKPEFPFRVPTARINFMCTAEERHARVL